MRFRNQFIEFLDMRELSPLPNPMQLRRWARSQAVHVERYGVYHSSWWVPVKSTTYEGHPKVILGTMTPL